MSQREVSVSEPIHVSDSNFEQTVLKAQAPAVVDFWAPWCGPCRMVAPLLDRLAREYTGKLVVAKINTDEDVKWAEYYRVQGIPTILFISNGRVMHQQVGAVSYESLKKMVDHLIENGQAATSAEGK
jgi:thioredoxin 1